MHYSIPFKFSLNSRESGMYPLRGTIRALDSDGNLLKKQGKEAKDILNQHKNCKDKCRKLDIRKDIQCACISDTSIKECIVAAAERLFSENKVLMGVQLEALTSPATITPYMAAQKYARDFVAEYHPKLTDEKFEAAVHKLIRDCHRLPAVPMCKLSPTKMKDAVKRIGMGRIAQEDIYKFFNFSLEYGVYEGINPVEKPAKKRKSGRDKQIKATRPDELTPDLQDALYEKLEQNISAINTAVALMASGLEPKEIVGLKWKDITFHTEIDDYVVIHILRMRKLSATHDYSRPLVPRSALILRNYYEAKKNKSRGSMAEKYVFPHAKNKGKHILPAAIIENATRILHSIGVGYGILGQLHREDRKMAAAKKILHTTYERNVRDVCNLNEDMGTVNYLLSRSFGSDVTADAYTSFSSDLGLYRLYSILKVLQKTEHYKETSNEILENGKITRVYYPDTNKEYAKVSGNIVVPPGEEIVIRCEHGCDGEYNVD